MNLPFAQPIETKYSFVWFSSNVLSFIVQFKMIVSVLPIIRSSADYAEFETWYSDGIYDKKGEPKKKQLRPNKLSPLKVCQ